jgi:undecaprenyl pyrophosphate phosphatase UppP
MYIDPGAGSMVIQAMLAAILAVPFFFRTQISRVVSRMRRMRSDSTEDASES